MRIAFINPSPDSKYSQPHMGLLSLATVCRDAGYDVSITNFAYDYDVCCITAMTPTISEAISLAVSIKRYAPAIKTILGGVHATIFGDSLLGLPFDAIVQGEGENIIFDVLEDIKHDRLEPLYKADKPVDMSTIPLPDYELINIKDYKPHFPHGIRKPWVPVITSRGCPFNCAFCSKAVFGSTYRDLSPARVLELLDSLVFKYGVKSISFYDDVFTLKRDRTVRICYLIYKAGLDIKWTCETRVNLVDEDLLKVMKDAGCYLIAYGIETGSQELLNTLNKGVELDQVRKAVKMTKDARIQTVGYFMLGSPGETKQTIQQTIDFACDIGLDYAQFGVTCPLPGSQLYTMYLSEGYSKPDLNKFNYVGDGDKPVFTSNELSADDIYKAVHKANREFYLRPGYMLPLGVYALKGIDNLRQLFRGIKMFAGFNK